MDSAFRTKKSTDMLLAQVVGLAYSPHDVSVKSLKDAGFKDVAEFDFPTEFNDTQALVIGIDDGVVIAFRGTESLLDIKTNMRFGFARSPLGGKMHEGFWEALEDRTCDNMKPGWDQIMAYVNKLASSGEYKNIYFTGHSLGGALAVIAATRFLGTDMTEYPEADKLKLGRVTAFGPPKCFDKEGAANFFKSAQGKAATYIYQSDFVTYMPVIGMEKRRVADLVNLPKNIGFYSHNEGVNYITRSYRVMENAEQDRRWPNISDKRLFQPIAQKRLGSFFKDHTFTANYKPAIQEAFERELQKTKQEIPSSIQLMDAVSKALPPTVCLVTAAQYGRAVIKVVASELRITPRQITWRERVTEVVTENKGAEIS